MTDWRPGVIIDGTVLVIILVAALVWLVLLTVLLWRFASRLDTPVYRRMPDGRLRFEWSVNTAYNAVRRAPRTCAVPDGDPRPGRYRAIHP